MGTNYTVDPYKLIPVKMLLTTKVQHRNFEAGEFVEEQKRNYEDTIAVIDNFPWEKEREKIDIGLTNPSVTITNDQNEFLKFALFFNGKFVLHFFSADEKLYTKSFVTRHDAYPYIKNFFQSGSCDINDFKLENTWLQHDLKHFVSNDFHYVVTNQSAWHYLMRVAGMPLLVSAAAAMLFLALIISHVINLPAALFLLIGSSFGTMNLILFLNYNKYAQGKILIMSRGNDNFSFGSIVSPISYNKQDIQMVTTYGSTRGKSPIYGFFLVKIEFKDGRTLYIPNIFVSEIKLHSKLYNCSQQVVNSFPYIRKSYLKN